MKHLFFQSWEWSHAELLWEWANDDLTRKMSFSSASIPWEAHLKWFKNQLINTHVKAYVVYENRLPIGQIRFDIQSDQAYLNYSLAPEARGQGKGALLIREGVERLLIETSVQQVIALVKEDNIASLKAFERLKFRKGASDKRDVVVLYYP